MSLLLNHLLPQFLVYFPICFFLFLCLLFVFLYSFSCAMNPLTITHFARIHFERCVCAFKYEEIYDLKWLLFLCLVFYLCHCLRLLYLFTPSFESSGMIWRWEEVPLFGAPQVWSFSYHQSHRLGEHNFLYLVFIIAYNWRGKYVSAILIVSAFENMDLEEWKKI